MLLSVCIPTFNRSAFIRVSARFWLEQLPPFADRVELIIADNASTDDTVAVLKSYTSLGPFRLIERPHHLTFNQTTHDLVVNQAKGDYVWVCGDDDYPNPGALAAVIAALEANPGQEHFHVATQFIPNDHPPDLTREDPRASPFIHHPQGDRSSHPVPQTKELLASEDAAFSGLYSSIWKRPLAVEALSGEFAQQPPFTSLETTLPYAFYIAQRRLEKPCYRLGHPLLTVVHTVSWPHYAALFRLQIMPDLYALYLARGVSPAVLRPHQLELLAYWPRTLLDLARHRRVTPRQKFSFLLYLRRYGRERRFWKELADFLWNKLVP